MAIPLDRGPDISYVACPMPVIKKNAIAEIQSGWILEIISAGSGSVSDMNASPQDGPDQPDVYKASVLCSPAVPGRNGSGKCYEPFNHGLGVSTKESY
jgi:hypothetical protein